MGWDLGKELGSGHFAKVYLVTRKSDGIQSACKIIKKPKGARGAAHARSRNSSLQRLLEPHLSPSTRSSLRALAELKKRALVAMEHKIITEVDHPYAVKCYDAFETGARERSSG